MQQIQFWLGLRIWRDHSAPTYPLAGFKGSYF